MVIHTARIWFSVLLITFLMGCSEKPKQSLKQWPFADTNSVISFKRITRQAPSGALQTGISLSSKEGPLFAIAYGRKSSGRSLIYTNTETVVWLNEKGEYAFPVKGQIVQGASMSLGKLDSAPVLLHIVQIYGEFFRTDHMLNLESEVAKEKIEATKLAKIGEAEIGKLIQDLRSPNLDPAPFGLETGIPVNYDLEAQKRVWRAETTLGKLGWKAFPALIRHINDTDYCKTEEGSELFSLSVGNVCSSLISRQINIAGAPHRFQDREGRKNMWDSSYFHVDTKSIASWWEENKGRKLEELQLESVEYVIAKEKALGFQNLGQEQKILTPLEKLRTELQSKIKLSAN